MTKSSPFIEKIYSKYSDFAAREIINHTIETTISGITALILHKIHIKLDNFTQSQLIIGGQLLKTSIEFIKLIHMKDAITEAITAISYFPGFNLMGWYSITENINPNDSIGEQEQFSQLTEFANRMIPIATYDILFDQKLKASNSIFALGREYNVWSEAIAFGRVPMYGIYESIYPNDSQISKNYFDNESRLHFNIEGSILILPAFISTVIHKSPNNFLFKELMIELFKGLEFKLINIICPKCSTYKEEFSEVFAKWMSDNQYITPQNAEKIINVIYGNNSTIIDYAHSEL